MNSVPASTTDIEEPSIISKAQLICGTALIWIIVCTLCELPGMAAVVHDPQIDDLGTTTWPFALFSFALFRLPLWCAGLCFVYAAEIALLTRRTRVKPSA